MNPLNRIKNQSKSKPLKEADIKLIHHIFMKEYGWIPLKEFMELPLPTMWNLYSVISEEKLAEYEENLKNKNKRK